MHFSYLSYQSSKVLFIAYIIMLTMGTIKKPKHISPNILFKTHTAHVNNFFLQMRQNTSSGQNIFHSTNNKIDLKSGKIWFSAYSSSWELKNPIDFNVNTNGSKQLKNISLPSRVASSAVFLRYRTCLKPF